MKHYIFLLAFILGCGLVGTTTPTAAAQTLEPQPVRRIIIDEQQQAEQERAVSGESWSSAGYALGMVVFIFIAVLAVRFYIKQSKE